MKGSHPRPADPCPFVLRHSISQVTSFMKLEMSCIHFQNSIKDKYIEHLQYTKYPTGECHTSSLMMFLHVIAWCHQSWSSFNTLKPRQNGRRFADDTFKHIFLNGNVRISIKISVKFVPKGPINNNPALVQRMAWRWSGNKPLSEPMMVSLLTHICVTRPQWVKMSYGVTRPQWIMV